MKIRQESRPKTQPNQDIKDHGSSRSHYPASLQIKSQEEEETRARGGGGGGACFFWCLLFFALCVLLAAS